MSRYSYSTTGYGVFSLMGEVYATGRIEVYDEKEWSGYAISEGNYWVPLNVEDTVRKFFRNLKTDEPILIEIGNFYDCERASAEKLDCEVEDLNDFDFVKKYHQKKYNEFLDSLSDEDKERIIKKYHTGEEHE